MRAAIVVLVLFAAARAPAEPLPPGAIGLVVGGVAGTGADNKRLGYGVYEIGAQASWQPTTTEHHVGWTLRWSTLFGLMYGGSAAQVASSLHTVTMDFTAGLRLRPWRTPSRYLTLRAGGELLRSNEPIPPLEHRSFAGAIGSIGLDQYAAGMLISVDLRYGMFVTGPGSLALLVGVGFTGP